MILWEILIRKMFQMHIFPVQKTILIKERKILEQKHAPAIGPLLKVIH